MKFVLDYDSLAYAAAAVCERKSVLVTHLPSGRQKAFKNKSTFQGLQAHKGKIGGWLEKTNEGREIPFKLNEFKIETVVSPVEVSEVYKVVDKMVQSTLDAAGYQEFADTYYGYIGNGETFRHKRARLLPYKGNRTQDKPLLLQAARTRLLEKHNAQLATPGLEADDNVNIDAVGAYLDWKHSGDDDDKIVLISIDKDSSAGPFWLFNPQKHHEPFLIEGLGKIWIEDNPGKTAKCLRGYGRKFFYAQLLYGDPVDNYKPSCASSVRYGPQSAYEDLKDCNTDQECWDTIVRVYKKFYPEGQYLIDYTGEEWWLDWFTALEEIFDLARMRTAPEDGITLQQALDMYKIDYPSVYKEKHDDSENAL